MGAKTHAQAGSALARGVSVALQHARRWLPVRWTRSLEQLEGDRGEIMPLLSKTALVKITSPPTRTLAAEPAMSSGTGSLLTAASDKAGHRKRVQQQFERANANAVDKTVTVLGDRYVYATGSWSSEASGRNGGPKTRLRSIVYAVALAAGLTSLCVLFQRHAPMRMAMMHEQAETESVMGANTISSNRMRGDDGDAEEDKSMIDEEAAIRRDALAELADELELLRAHEVRRAVNGELNTTLRVGVAHFNNGPIALWTRAYESSIPGPLLSLQPGDTLNLEIVNELEHNSAGEWSANTYHDPNNTNIHVHGMHVDPTGIADNIFRTLPPGETMRTQIHVPKNHPRGLYHYHPHYHGSVFLQMAGGMTGPIVIEDDDATLPDEYKHMKSHVLVLQEFRFDGGLGSDLLQAAEASRSELNMRPEYTSKTLLDEQVRALFPSVHPYSQPTDIPLGKKTRNRFPDGFAPKLSRFYVVNGQYLPKIEVQPLENVMLRLLNAGGASTVEIALPGCSILQVASDGSYLPKPRMAELLLLSPGARADVVINCRPIDFQDPEREPLRPLQSVQDPSIDYFLGGSSDVYQGVLAFVHVSGLSRNMDLVSTTPPLPELYAHGDLLHLSIEDTTKVVPFRFEFTMGEKHKKDGFPYKDYFINHVPFNMTSMRDMPLNQVQEWVIVNERDESGKKTKKNHPFHLHTNAFQVVGISHGEGVDYKLETGVT